MLRMKAMGTVWCWEGKERKRGSRTVVGMEVLRDSLRTNPRHGNTPSPLNHHLPETFPFGHNLRNNSKKEDSLSFLFLFSSFVSEGVSPFVQVMFKFKLWRYAMMSSCSHNWLGSSSSLQNYWSFPAIMAFWSKMFWTVLHIENTANLLSLIVLQNPLMLWIYFRNHLLLL